MRNEPNSWSSITAFVCFDKREHKQVSPSWPKSFTHLCHFNLFIYFVLLFFQKKKILSFRKIKLKKKILTNFNWFLHCETLPLWPLSEILLHKTKNAKKTNWINKINNNSNGLVFMSCSLHNNKTKFQFKKIKTKILLTIKDFEVYE